MAAGDGSTRRHPQHPLTRRIRPPLRERVGADPLSWTPTEERAAVVTLPAARLTARYPPAGLGTVSHPAPTRHRTLGHAGPIVGYPSRPPDTTLCAMTLPPTPPQPAPEPQPPAGYAHTAYPVPPGQQPPYPPPAPPKRGMSTGKVLLIIGGGLLALCCIGGVVTFAVGGNAVKKATDSAASASPAQPAATTAAATTKAAAAHPKLNQPARDGKFEFVVTKVQYGVAKVGDQYLNKTAQGQFALVTVTVTNIGKEPRTFTGGNQKATGPGGVKYTDDGTAGIYANSQAQTFLNNINPGNSVSGVLVFDIPKDAKLAAVELHDSAFSGGVTVDLG